jgi:hypothetical protein
VDEFGNDSADIVPKLVLSNAEGPPSARVWEQGLLLEKSNPDHN